MESVAASRAESTPHQDLSMPSPTRSQSPVEAQMPVRRNAPWFKRAWEPLKNLKTRKNK